MVSLLHRMKRIQGSIEASMTEDDIFSRLSKTARRCPHRQAIGFFRGGQLQYWTYREFLEEVKLAALGLWSLGFRRGDRLAFLAPNSAEWAILDFAAFQLGLVTVPIHTTLSAGQIRHLLLFSGAKGLVLGRGGALEGFQVLCSLLAGLAPRLPGLIRQEFPRLKHIFFLEDLPVVTEGQKRAISLFFGEILDRGRKLRDRNPSLPEGPRPEDVASICYTSGTTGEMKGVMLTHRNLLSNALACTEATGGNRDDVHLATLPLSHAFEHTCGLLMHLFLGATVVIGRGPAYLMEDLQAARPTLTGAVPRMLEKICLALKEKLSRKGRLASGLFHFSLKRTRLFREWSEAKNPLRAIVYLENHLADRIFYQKIRDAFGGRLKKIVCGGAPLDPHIAGFFLDVGIKVQEGYGLTEHAPTIAVNPPHRLKLGSVGKPLPQVDVRIGKENEILVRGPCVMKGYEKNPKETSRVLDGDGWLHTGDQGFLDEEGYLFVRGRLKEMIVTGYGKNVYPAPIEQAIQRSPFVKQAMVVGEGRPYLVALVVPDKEHLKAGGIEGNGHSGGHLQRLLLEQITRFTSDFAEHERVKKVLVIPEAFSETNDLLTPTLKLRRPKIEDHYRAGIDSLYRT